MSEKEIKKRIPTLNEKEVNQVKSLMEEHESELIGLIKFLEKQVTDNCCHTLLDEDDCVERIENVLNN